MKPRTAPASGRPGGAPAAGDRVSLSNTTRTAILDATEEIIRDEGYAAVSSRKVASRAGLKSQLVHYYFKAMDELFMAVLHRVEEQHFQRLAQAVASKAPLRSIWGLLVDSHGPRLTKEFVAMATHRDMLRKEIARSAERTRSIVTALLSKAMDEQGMGHAEYPPVVMAVLMDGAARLIVSDAVLGTSAGHEETIAFVERFLDRLEPGAPRNAG